MKRDTSDNVSLIIIFFRKFKLLYDSISETHNYKLNIEVEDIPFIDNSSLSPKFEIEKSTGTVKKIPSVSTFKFRNIK